MPSLLSDELLADVIAAGQADVLVGLPTQNHAKTAGAVARVVVAAFAGPFVRERTVLLNLDGGSTDGTPEAVRSAVPATGDIVSGQYALRTIHRITAPYHGVPGRSSALRTLLTVAELLRARAVFIADPTADALTIFDVAAWVRAVLAGGADYVKPVTPRARYEGTLITQIVRPLFGAACGARLLEPLDTQLACSGRFTASAVAADFWKQPQAEIGPDAFLTVHALTGEFRLMQVATQACGHVEAERRPRTAELFQQVMGSVLDSLARTFPLWAGKQGSCDVSVEGVLPAPPARAPQFSLPAFRAAFRTGVDALAPLLGSVLEESLLERLRAAAQLEAIALDDSLWAAVVLSFLRAAVKGTTPPAQLAQMLEPLYLGRVVAYVNGPADAGEPERLALAFEEQRASLVGPPRGQEDEDGKQRYRSVVGGA
jgi:hypothetical protein